MNTREIAVEYRLSHWAELIKGRGECGLTVRAYCESLGIHENSYYYWLKKLREAACEKLAGNYSKTNSLTSPVFAEVKLPVQSAMLPFDGVAQNRICVETAGVRITADGEYPADKLAELLRTVMRSC